MSVRICAFFFSFLFTSTINPIQAPVARLINLDLSTPGRINSEHVNAMKKGNARTFVSALISLQCLALLPEFNMNSLRSSAVGVRNMSRIR